MDPLGRLLEEIRFTRYRIEASRTGNPATAAAAEARLSSLLAELEGRMSVIRTKHGFQAVARAEMFKHMKGKQ